MTYARNSIPAFLKHAKSSLKQAMNQQQKITIIAGNQSADLDSMTCSILFAWLRSQLPPSNSFTPLYIPLLNIPSADIHLRPEFLEVFDATAIDASQIPTLDDLGPSDEWSKTLNPDLTRWILVDHNKLEGKLGEVYGKRVHGVIDHHEEEDSVPQNTDPEPRVVEKSGSCTSLIVRELKPTWIKLRGQEYSEAFATYDAEAAKLALASILVDTKNLTAEQKVQDVDRESVEYLQSIIHAVDTNFERKVYFNAVNQAKKAIEDLALEGIFRKDYKEWTEGAFKLGMSSCVKPLDFLSRKASKEESQGGVSWNETSKKFIDGLELDLWVVMTASVRNGERFERELLARWSRKDGQEMVEKWARATAKELQLEDKKVGGLESGQSRIWRQGNTAWSRKQVGPSLRKAIRGYQSEL